MSEMTASEWMRTCFVRRERGWECTIERGGEAIARCGIQHRKRDVGERCMKRLLWKALHEGEGK